MLLSAKVKTFKEKHQIIDVPFSSPSLRADKSIPFKAMFDRLVLKNIGSSTTAWVSTPGGRTSSVGRTFFLPENV
jgi:hypothetical protein